jgi:hypothetical protein
MEGKRHVVGRRQLIHLVAVVMVATGLTVVSGLSDAAQAVSVQTNVNVTRQAGNQAEGAIAIDPTNPLRMFTVANNLAGGLSVAVSTDAGVTWATRTIGTGSDSLPPACCDPSVSWDTNGNLFLAYLDANVNNGAVHVLLSTNGGQGSRLSAIWTPVPMSTSRRSRLGPVRCGCRGRLRPTR